MLIFFFCIRGRSKGSWHYVMSLWLFEQSGRASTGKTQLNLPGLLLHLPVNEHCCWRYPCVPCREASRQHLHLTLLTTEENGSRCDRCFRSPGEKAIRDLYSQRPWMYHNCYMCLPQCTSGSLRNKESALSSIWHQKWQKWVPFCK